MKKRICALFLTTVLSAILFLTACGGAGDDGSTSTSGGQASAPIQTSHDESGVEGTSDETLTVGHFGEPVYLVTQQSTTQPGVLVMNMIYDALLWWDNDSRTVQPAIATEWEMVDDYTWRFKLRDDVVAYDGTILTAEDVYYSFKKGTEGPNSTAFKHYDMEKSAVVDEFTVDIATKTPMPYLDTMLSNIALAHIIDESSVEAAGGFDAAVRNPLCGTGPYRFAEWVEGEYILLERNDDYWGELPYYKEVKIQFISDAATRIMALESGDVDAIATVPVAQANNLLDRDDLKLWIQDSDLTNVLYMNCTRAPFDNVQVRQAIAHLVDQEALLQIVGGGYGYTADTNIPKLLSVYSEPTEGETYAYNVDDAKALLAEAGYADGFSMTLTVQQGAGAGIAEVLKNTFAQAGIQLEIDIIDVATMLQRYDEGDYDAVMAIGMFGGDLSKPLSYYDNRLTFDEADGGTGWGSDEMNALIDTASTTRDDDERMQTFAEIQSLLRENVPLIGCYSYSSINATTSDLTGLTLDVRGMPQFRGIRPAA